MKAKSSPKNMTSITLRIINGKSYQILSDMKYHPFLKDGMESDSIALDGDNVILMRDLGYIKFLWSLQDIRNEIDSVKNSTKWRNEERRIETLQYYRNILNIMTGYQREQIIDDVLRNEDYNDTLCLAC